MKKSMTQRHAGRKRKMKRRCRPGKHDLGRPQMSAAGLCFDLAERAAATGAGGVGLIHKMCETIGLKQSINENVTVLKQHQPYYESDHVLTIAFNVLAGGTCLDHVEHCRKDIAFLDMAGMHSMPGPSTLGDFCRRFENRESVDMLQEAFNRSRVRVWSRQDAGFFARAVIDADGTLCPTKGECKEGMDIAYDGTWGYHPLVVSLSNTGEVLYLLNRPGSRPSHEGAAHYLSRAAELCGEAGFQEVHFRGDTDFSQTTHLDRWDEDGITFTFGLDRHQKVVKLAKSVVSEDWTLLSRPPARARRARQVNHKNQVIDKRGFRHLRLAREEVAEIPYRPTACRKAYRLIMLKKTIAISEGLFKDFGVETRYHFFLTNRTDLSPAEVVHDAHQRCNQENLNAHLKGGVHALTMPLNTFHANWAWSVMAALAWSLKAWAALLLPAKGRWKKRHAEEKRRLLRMEFHTFRQALVNIPAQIARTGRRLLVRLLAWNEWLPAFFRLAGLLSKPLRC